LIQGCKTPPPEYRLCAFIDDKGIFLWCESTDEAEKPYAINIPNAEREGYLAMPIDDYRAILKYAKQVEKDLERCRK